MNLNNKTIYYTKYRLIFKIVKIIKNMTTLREISNISTIKHVLKEVKNVLNDLYKDKLVDIILYGSYARGDQKDESDIDLAIIIDDDIRPFREIEQINDEIYDIDLKYSVVISIHPISKRKFLVENHSYFKNLKKEGISLCQMII